MKLGRNSVNIMIFSTVLFAGCGTADRDWKRAQNANTAVAYAHFLADHPQGAHVNEARTAIENLDWDEAYDSRQSPAGYLAFYRAHPESSRIRIGQATIASEVNLQLRSHYNLPFAATSELLITVGGAKVDMNAEDACKMGIVTCEVAFNGPLAVKTKPARAGKILWETARGSIVAVEFAEQGSGVSSEAIHYAALSGDVEKAKALLKANPDLVLSKDSAGHTPLIEAALWGYRDMAELLLANKADVNAKDSEGETPLHWAMYREHLRMAKLLLDNHAEVNSRDKYGGTPLREAAVMGESILVEFLLANKADPNAKDMFGETPLHRAAYNGNKEVAAVLLANKAEINAKSLSGWTPLHKAAGEGEKDVVELLLANKADPNAKDDHGETPLHVATRFGHKDVAELLRQHGGHE